MPPLRKIVWFALAALTMACGVGMDCRPAPAGTIHTDPSAGSAQDSVPRLSEEEQAVAALYALGVPLERDSRGRVRWIEAVKGQLNDEALHHLRALPALEWLEIGGGPATPAGMAQLAKCSSLRRLYVHDLDLGGDSLAWLSGLPLLRALSMQRTGITGKALGQLKALGTLTVLNLSDNNITNADLNRIARIPGLEVLALQNTRVTGSGLAELKGLMRLNVLNLVNCPVADGDLDHFMSLPSLRIVHAAGCGVGEEAIRDLNQKLPMLSIFSSEK